MSRILVVELHNIPAIVGSTRQLSAAVVPVLRCLLDDSSMDCNESTRPIQYELPGEILEPIPVIVERKTVNIPSDYDVTTWIDAHPPTCNAHPHVLSVHRNGSRVTIFTCCEGWFVIDKDRVPDPFLLEIQPVDVFVEALLEWLIEANVKDTG